MLPAQLKPADFAAYLPQGRALVTENLELVQQLPLPYLIVLLREVIQYDFRFPAEQQRITGHLLYLNQLQKENRITLLQGFASLHLNTGLEQTDWVANPSSGVEQMTAWLWSSHQMDAFRQAAEDLNIALTTAVPPRQPGQPRLAMVVVGQDATPSTSPLFRKLQPHGVHLIAVKPDHGFDILLAEAERRAQIVPASSPEAFLHWYIDGGASAPASTLTSISYAALQPARLAMLERTGQAIDSGSMGPERLRTLLARLRPEDIGLHSNATPASASTTLDHFQLSLLTEGSGTQIFATTFVQWAARECLRRAEPETLLLRFAPRQKQQPMNAMITGHSDSALDPQGSLIDADMGAYYTWLNLQRLSGANQTRFLAWFEGRNEAIVIGQGLPRGAISNSSLDMHGVLKLLA